MEIVSALVIGFLLGLKHALDPDHVVAVSNMVATGTSVSEASKVGRNKISFHYKRGIQID